MKSVQLFSIGLLAITGLLAAPNDSRAAVVTTQGDLILAFRTNDASVPFDLEVDFGLASTFTTWALNNPGSTLNLNVGSSYFTNGGGLAASDLVAVYGANWNSNSALVFSLAGAEVNKTLYANAAVGLVQPRKPTGSQTQAAGKLDTMRGTLNGFPNTFDNGTTTVNLTSSQAAVLDSGQGGSYTSTISGVKDYNYFDIATEGTVTNSGSTVLSFFKLTTGTSGLPGQNLGTLSLSSAGVLNFTAAPEPTSAMLLGISAMTLIFRRRRLTA